jgi:7-cyano-7-deazaguanine synthase in queuosine biosynthesis
VEPDRLLIRRKQRDHRLYELKQNLVHRKDWFREPTISLEAKGDDCYAAFVKDAPAYFWSPDGARVIFASSPGYFVGICPPWQSPKRVPNESVVELPTFKIETLYQETPRRAVVPFSGGIDCTIIAVDLLQRGYKVQLVHIFDEKRGEFKRALDLSRLITGASWESRRGRKAPLSYINLACRFALGHGNCLVPVGGTVESDNTTYPGIVSGMNEAASHHHPLDIQFCMPFHKLTDEQVFDYGVKIGAPLTRTSSCEFMVECGVCHKCLKRKAMLKRLNKTKYLHAVEVKYPSTEELARDFEIT